MNRVKVFSTEECLEILRVAKEKRNAIGCKRFRRFEDSFFIRENLKKILVTEFKMRYLEAEQLVAKNIIGIGLPTGYDRIKKGGKVITLLKFDAYVVVIDEVRKYVCIFKGEVGIDESGISYIY